MNKTTLYLTSSVRATGIKRTLLFCCFLLGFCLSGLPAALAQITGPSTVCSGVPNAFGLSGTPSSAYTYTWTVAPAADATILTSSGTGSTIQWVSTAATSSVITVTIVRPSQPNVVWTKNVTVVPQPDPQITTNTIVGCQGVEGDREKGKVTGTIIDDGACIKVCQNSSVQYTVVGGQPGSSFAWTIDPGKGSFAGPSTGTTVTVNWSNIIGFTFIKVKETTSAGCVKEKSVCIEIIESPDPLFSVNGDVTPAGGPGSCFQVCVQEPVQFADLTPTSLSSPIVSWQWDFGDGTYSSIQYPQHTYLTATTYWVSLKVTNQCGCIGIYKVCIKVNHPNAPPVEILCPSIVCENAIGHYTIDNSCPGMTWSVNGGTITNATINSVDILWNSVGPSGFGEIIADFTNCGGNCSPKVTAQVPVIQATGTISGKAVICKGKQYKYTLPQWPSTNFKWSIVPAGSAFIVGYDENSYEVNLVGYAPFTLHCEYKNTLMLCAGSADLYINVVDPMTLVAPEKTCLGTSTSIITTSPVSGGTTYTFIDPNGNTSVAGTFNMTGVWTIQASNPSFCEIDPVSIQVVDPPVPFTSISGETKVCFNTPYVYQALTPMPNTICNWSVSGGTPPATTGNAATISWTSGGTISITRSFADLPGCTSSAVVLNVAPAAPSINITGNLTPCANTTETYTATLTGDPFDDIQWSVSGSGVGSVSSGQNTMTPTITWNSTNLTSVACSLVAVISKCGTTTTVSLPITVIGTPTVTVSASNSTPCSGVPVIFTATPTPASASISWALTGGVPATGSGLSATTTFTNLGNASQNFTVTATASVAGCLLTGSGTNTVAVKPQPNINVSPGSGASSTILTCNPVNIPLLLSTNTTTSINWYLNGSFLTSGVTSYPATSVGTYRIDVVNSFGCSSSVTRVIALDPGCGVAPCTLPGSAGVSSKNHSITTCANSSGYAIVDVNFNGVYGTYMSSGSGTNILNLAVSGNSAYCTLPTISYGSFPNIPITGIQISKPGEYPVTLRIGYEVSPGVACYKFVTEKIIVPVIADFDYTTNCVPGGYTLTLNEQSPILSGYTTSGSTWTVNGSPVSPGSINLSSYTPGSNLSIVHSITVTDGTTSYTCSRTRSYVVPTVPNPAFSILTTDPTGPNSSSCGLRAVVFTSINNTGVTNWTWDFGDMTGFISSSSINASRTYDNPGSTTPITVTLTLRDAFGCTYPVSNSFSLIPNIFSVNSVNTYTLPEEIKCEGTSSSITASGVTGGYTPLSYSWYEQQTPIAATGNPISVTTSGLYWTRVTDSRGCQVAANPTAAKRAFQPLPDVAIFGAHDYCPYQAIKLNGINGGTTGFNYQWQELIGAVWTNISGATAGILDMPSGLPAGVHQYRIVVSQNLPTPYSGSCPATSPAFTVTIHALPNTPYIGSPMVLNCSDYSIQLNVSTPQAGVNYNWSNGTAGVSTVVNHGGAYRVWATNIWGCQNHSDVDVPIEPSAYFWRFPHGCYSFCRDQLPREVDGPSFVIFAGWDWLFYGSGLPYPNGSWPSSGVGSVVAPLNINLDPTMGGDGNGSGKYSWRLNNGLCTQTSHEMSIDINKGCCKLDANWAYFNCIKSSDATGPTYYGGINVYGMADCAYASYTVYALDPVTGLPNGTVAPASGTYTAGGTISFVYTPFPGVTDVKFQVVINCDGKECIGTPETIYSLPSLPCSDITECPVDMKWEYFECKRPKGSSTSFFVGGVQFMNPLGCAATSYTITAVDPGTGLPNGTVVASTSTVPPGWSSVYFTYTPDPGVTAVKFIITFVCDGRVCQAYLGEFDDINNPDRYPCKDYASMAKKLGSAATVSSSTMVIAPNPASDKVKISFNNPNWKQGDYGQISVVNLLGVTVAKYNISNTQGVWQLSTQEFVSGIYIVRLVNEGKNIEVQHMVITH